MKTKDLQYNFGPSYSIFIRKPSDITWIIESKIALIKIKIEPWFIGGKLLFPGLLAQLLATPCQTVIPSN